MKKLLKISMAAVFAVIPMLAFGAAGDVNKDPGATTAGAPVATNSPKYALAAADSTTDGNAASAGYVKGAYNAAIKAVNRVAEEVDALESATSNYLDRDLVLLNETGAENIAKKGIYDSSVAYTSYSVGGAIKANAAAISAETSRATGVEGTLSSLTTDSKANLVAAINEVDAHADANASAISGLQTAVSAIESAASNYANTSLTNVASGAVTSGLIGSNAVTSAAIATSAVTTDEIANGTILTEDINSAAMMISSDPEVVALPGSETLVTAGVMAEQIYSVRSEIEDLPTKTGVEKTIKNVALNAPAVTQGITGSVAATTSTILTIMTEWGSSTSSAVSAVTSVTNGTLNTNVTVAAPTIYAASVSYTE